VKVDDAVGSEASEEDSPEGWLSTARLMKQGTNLFLCSKAVFVKNFISFSPLYSFS